jgi:hypothetical protein
MANETLFGRRVKLIIAAPLASDFNTISAQTTEIVDMRVVFKVTKTLSKDPNSAEIKVYNLSDATRAGLAGKGAKVLLQAGYDQTLAQVFLGDARFIESKREGVEWVTTFECGDGARSYQHARVSESFAGGVSVSDVVSKIGAATGLDVGNLSGVAPSLTGQYTQGYTAHGPAYKELEKVLKAAGYELSTQDGTLQVLAPGETTTEPVVILDSDSGLIGSPEMGSAEKKGGKAVLSAKSLLQPFFRPGRRVRVKSRQYSGDFKAVKVEHEGDTAGGNWYSNLELEAL